MLLKLLIGLVFVVAALAGFVAARPNVFSVSRSIAIEAPPMVVFENVNNLRIWDSWSPWEKLDPEMIKTYEGPATGAGAAYRWEGNDEVGTGSLAIVESRAPELVAMRLDFLKPFEASNQVKFTFVPEGNSTLVTWTMTGELNFMMKACHLVMNMDKMCGAQFEQGLADLKALSEQSGNTENPESVAKL